MADIFSKESDFFSDQTMRFDSRRYSTCPIGLRSFVTMPFLHSSMELHQYLDHMLKKQVSEVIAYCLSNHKEECQETLTVSVPSSWWQHFKQDVFPLWLRCRFPVKLKNVTRTINTTINNWLCPHADVPWKGPGIKYHIDFLDGNG